MSSASRQQGPNMKVIAGVVVAVVVATMIAILAVTAGDDDSSGNLPPEFGTVDVTGGALPPLPETGPDFAAGATAPSVRGEGPDGAAAIEPSDLDEPAVLVFLAHWCPHCQAELPRLVELQEKGAFDDLRAIAVLTGTDSDAPNFPPSAWLDQEGWTEDRLYDDEASTAARAYGVSSFPFIVLLDEEGAVFERLAGEQPPGAIEDALSSLTGGS